MSKEKQYKSKYYAENIKAISERARKRRIEKRMSGVKMKNTCAKTVPNWLIDLPPGRYFLQEIVDRTEQNYNNVYARLTALEVHRELMSDNDKKHVYTWKGAKYYVKKYMNERLGG